MNVSRRIFRLFILVLAATALAVGTSSAQDFEGRFTLPVQTQWGNVVLQPGAYTMNFTRFLGGQRLLVVRSDQNRKSAALIVPRDETTSPSVAASQLICVREGGGFVVRSLEIAPLGETVKFKMPSGAVLFSRNRNGIGHALLAEATGRTELVPISPPGK